MSNEPAGAGPPSAARDLGARDSVGEAPAVLARRPAPMRRSLLWRTVDVALLLAVLGMVVTVNLQVVSRILGNSLPWTEELTRFLFLWATFLGMASGFRSAEHARITFAIRRMPRVLRRLTVHLYAILGIGFFAAAAYYGALLMLGQYRSNETSPTLGVSMSFVTAALVVSAVLAAVAHVQSVYFDPATREPGAWGRGAGVSWLLIGLFVALSLLGVPLAVALGLAALLALLLNGFPLSIVPQAMYTSMNSFILVAVPLFVLAGNLMERGGMSARIFDFADSIVGRWRGGLGNVNVVASMIFGGISGSSVADVASLGPLEISAMTERKYPKDYAAALTMVTSTLSSVIPPSILMIVAAATAGESVGAALAGGLGPGILLGAVFIGVNYAICVRKGYGQTSTVALGQALRTMLVAVPALTTPVVILYGMFGGFVTPTEAAALAVVYTFVVSSLFYKDLRVSDLPGILVKTGKTTGTILLIAMSASVATYVFTADGLPAQVSNAILSISDNEVAVLLLMGVIFVAIGTVMDIIAAILILVPVLGPTAQIVGIDPIHFIVFMVVALAVGLSTPPVGICLFATAYVSGLSIERIARAAVPYYLALLVVLLLVALVPAITLWPVGLFDT